MRKLRIDNSQLTIIATVLIFTFSIVHFPLSISSALALDSTPSADIKAKLEELKKEIASKAAKLKQEVNRKLQNKAYVGTIKTKSSTSLTLATKTLPRIVTLNQDTIYESDIKSKQKFSLKTLAEEDYITALGDIDDNGVLTAKNVILLPTTNLPFGGPLPTYLWGQVISISDNLITIKNRDLKNVAVSVTSQTNMKRGDAEVSFGSLKTNDFVILTGFMGKNEILVARFIYIYPSGGILKPKNKLSTPSAKLSTPSATPKTSPTPSAKATKSPKP